jgi:hypothetical protein
MLLLLVSCGDDRTIEQQIIATIELMEVAAENGEHFEFMGYVADSFKGQRGSMTRRDFHRFMIFQINQHRRLHAQLFPIRVQETFEGQASAQFNVLVTGGPGLLPDSGQLFEVKTHWILDGGDWLLSDADWVPLQLSDR